MHSSPSTMKQLLGLGLRYSIPFEMKTKFFSYSKISFQPRAMEALGLESRAKPLLPKTEKAPKPVRRAPRGGKKNREAQAEDPQEQEPAAKAKAKAKAGVKKATKKKGE